MRNIVYRSLFSMGTRLELVLPGVDDERGDLLLSPVRAALGQWEEKLSIYKEESDFSLLNKHAAYQDSQVDDLVLNLILKLKKLSTATLGYFNFTLGKIDNLEAITQDEWKNNWLPYLGTENIQIDEQSRSIRFSNDKISLDSGGFGKGLALDQIRSIFEKQQIGSALINFGGSSIMCIGSHPYGDCWKTGITHIFDETQSIYTFELKDSCLSVSGNTPQNMAKNNKGHIVNPISGKRIEGYFQVAVSGPIALETEILSTALSCAPDKKSDEIMHNFPAYKALIIKYDHKGNPYIHYTHNIKNE